MTANPHLERLRLLSPVRGRIAAGLACLVLAVGVQLAFPKAISWFIDNIGQLKGGGIPAGAMLMMLAVIVAHALVSTLRYYLFQSSGLLIVTNIRRRLFNVLINQPVGFYDKHHVGELTGRLSSDVQALHETLTMSAAGALSSLCVFVGGIAMLLQLSPSLSLPLLLFVPVSLYLGKLSGASYRTRARAVQASLADSSKVAHEHFANVRLVHAFNQQAGALAKYVGATAHLLKVSLASARLLSVFQGAISLLVMLALLVTLWFGAHLISQGKLTVGELTAFVIYASMVTEAASSISEFWNSWMRTLGATDRIFEILATHQELAAAGRHAPLAGDIAFEDVVFSYPERPDAVALRKVAFRIGKGEKVALVGSSGAGKSTIASLILGHYQPGSGRLLFDNVDAQALGVASIRGAMAIVEQEPSLFSGTIAENIAFAVPGRDVPLAEVMEAARQANAHDFIAGFPQGYDTVVGERGVQLSGGQKQRIAIARAMLRDPKILILDEATSALDSASELLVQRALDRLMEGRTTIIIAHRFSTIVKADRILVIADGAVRQQGTHEQLLRQRDGLYFHLMQHQLHQHDALQAAV
ncbi:MAG: ABC transporter transmembrane domain-containing protein [Pseudomonadota bacterium]